jgi:hypothetical protein
MNDMTPIRAAKPTLRTTMVPLEKLVITKINVRKHGPKDVDSLAASIAAKGLLQPLLVRPMGDKFEVVFGGRRTLALRKLNAQDTRTRTPCRASSPPWTTPPPLRHHSPRTSRACPWMCSTSTMPLPHW